MASFRAVNVLTDAKKFGMTVGAARGAMKAPYDKKTNFAKLLGTSVPTLTRMEEGAVGTIGRTEEERRQLAERIVKKSGCPPEWFGLSEPSEEPPDLRLLVAELEGRVAELAKEMAERLDEPASPPLTRERSERTDSDTGS